MAVVGRLWSERQWSESSAEMAVGVTTMLSCGLPDQGRIGLSRPRSLRYKDERVSDSVPQVSNSVRRCSPPRGVGPGGWATRRGRLHHDTATRRVVQRRGLYYRIAETPDYKRVVLVGLDVEDVWGWGVGFSCATKIADSGELSMRRVERRSLLGGGLHALQPAVSQSGSIRARSSTV